MGGFVSSIPPVAPTVPSAFIPGEFTVSSLPTPNAANVDMYARVTDLFGEKRDLVLCSQIGSTYFWQPVRAQYAKNITLNTDITLTALKSPSIVLGAGTLTSNRNIVLSSDLAYPGASFEIGFDGGLGLFGLYIKNTIGNTLASLLAGGRKRYFFADGDWRSF